jgi:hypothetical protein
MVSHRFSTPIAVLIGALSFVATAARAEMPSAPAQEPSADIQTIADGCGYGYHRTASGRCDNVRDYNAWCQKGFHKVKTPNTRSGYRCVQDGY